MLNQSILQQFTGTEQYYKHWLNGIYTDGVKYLADSANAYWLLDAIFSYHRKEPFQIWYLQVKEDKSAILFMQEDSNAPIKVLQEIEYTDFPLKNITLYLIDNTLLLPSEY